MVCADDAHPGKSRLRAGPGWAGREKAAHRPSRVQSGGQRQGPERVPSPQQQRQELTESVQQARLQPQQR